MNWVPDDRKSRLNIMSDVTEGAPPAGGAPQDLLDRVLTVLNTIGSVWIFVLMVLIDTEEEFDWSRPVARENTGVRSIKAHQRGFSLAIRSAFQNRAGPVRI